MWIYILRHGLPEALQSSTSTPLRAEACAALATIGSQIFECLPVRTINLHGAKHLVNFFVAHTA